VSEVFSQMGEKNWRQLSRWNVQRRSCGEFLLSLSIECLLAFCQKPDRTADGRITSSVCAVTGSKKNFRSASEVFMVESVCFELVLEQLIV